MADRVVAAERDEIADAIAGFRYDPLGFVLYVFDWGHGDLKGQAGPDEWQRGVLEDLGEELRRVDRDGGAIRIAVASGHGIGKTALICWIILFFMSTQPDVEIVVTANTKAQLETKTWRQLSLWWKRAINRDWFQKTATKFYASEAPDTWFCAAIPWSEENPEAFAGAGDAHSRTVLLFDEASGIPDVIHESTEGALLRGRAAKVAFGNPTRNTGWFRECWRRFADRWITRQIDSRTAKMADKAEAERWIQDYGEDSDFVRVRVKGQFPRAGSMQFIADDTVREAIAREAVGFDHMPKVLGVDVARYGDDRTVFCRRQGTRVWPMEKVRGWDTVQVATRVGQIIRGWKPDVVFVDGIGIGAGVVDYLKHTGFQVVDVVGSRKPTDGKTYLNLRAEMWGGMKEWLETGALPDDEELHMDLIGPEYAFNSNLQIVLEKKEDMKRRGLESPDAADALALTFASPAMISQIVGANDDEDDWAWQSGRNAVTGY